ncbi:ras guanine-nucleotide exchange [Lecanosticta acicola]|uniref:Ras guanine-nucleotide exchange n=1 Tax=Lecanosticta acicola TaxID=111012 RepID=A0AAI8YTW8_9PEZI|nr:ras guanine-nucleotide exchange [Lecanosticta acicola]
MTTVQGAAALRPRSEDMNNKPNDATTERRPSAPSIRTPGPSSGTVKSRTRKLPRLQLGDVVTNGFVTHITPPETPSSLSPGFEQTASQSLFHNYLRAMHAFDPSVNTMPDDDASQSAIALKSGDLVLVHCIHANGWADGTVLNTGDRGWLPTNYCEPYDHSYLRNLLNAMTQFWDLIGGSEDASLSTFIRQDYIRGLIAGVRYLLERADCLHRDAPLVKQHVGVRRMRKGLLADLSSLVQIAKRLQDTIGEAFAGEVIHVLLDDLVSKAFKVVTRAVALTDVWTQETSHAKGGYSRLDIPRPLNPHPPEKASLAIDTKAVTVHAHPTTVDSAKDFTVHPDTHAIHNACAGADDHRSETAAENAGRGRRSMVFTPPDGVVAHRVSLVAPENNRVVTTPLASEQLSKVHDICISHIGAFIGHHLHSRPCSELVATSERLVEACRNMLEVVDEVCAHDSQGSLPVQQAKEQFQLRIEQLATSTQAVFRFSDSLDDEAIMLPDQANHLINVGTSLIRNTGECVMRTRQLIEQIGDFQLRTSILALARSTPEPSSQDARREEEAPQDETTSSPKRISLSHRLSKSMRPPPTNPPQKELPDDPVTSSQVQSPTGDDAVSPITPTTAPSIKAFPLPPTMRRPRSIASYAAEAASHVADSLKRPRSFRSISTSPARKDSVGMSLSGSTDTYRSSARDSNATGVSQVSTRATTPEHANDAASSDPALMPSFASLSSMRSLATEDGTEAEALLQKTYAHELTLNRDGQVTGGSLPALVEQLTTHDSAPDPQFVTAFFLTFRKFCEPREFAQALIQRFDYIGDGRTVGTPARLRIYNIFKGWLETYWSAEVDRDALGEIRFFGLHKLKPVLPAAGERLVELTRRITDGYAYGTIRGPLVSGVGKTSMSLINKKRGNSDLPEALITLKQLNMLRLATGGGAPCSIVDFDAMEIARQITLRVMKSYCEIRPEELLSMDWSKPNTRKAKHVRDMCLLNTDLAHWVGDSILAPDEPKKRAAIVKQWIKIGAACVELSNYDSVMAIACTLNSSVIARLKRTWDLLNKKTMARFEELKNVVDTSRNYTALRRRLETPTASCLPFLGVYLTDLTFVVAGNPKRRELPGSASSETGEVVSVVNFDMYMRIAKIISHLQKFQVTYPLKTVPEMQAWIDQHLARMRAGHDEMVSAFHRRSLAVEPKHDHRKHSLAASAFVRSDSEERPRTAGGKHEIPPPVDSRFDLFMKGSSFSMRGTSALTTAEAREDGKRSSAH